MSEEQEASAAQTGPVDIHAKALADEARVRAALDRGRAEAAELDDRAKALEDEVSAKPPEPEHIGQMIGT
jgi:hypothetical protein